MVQDTTRRFEPERHGFRKMRRAGPADLKWYERHFDGFDDGGNESLRVNVYLTRDGSFTTIWYGVLDPFLTELTLGIKDHPALNLSEIYEEVLFRGDIEEDVFGEKLLKAIRLHGRFPCVLSMSDEFGLECHRMMP